MHKGMSYAIQSGRTAWIMGRWSTATVSAGDHPQHTGMLIVAPAFNGDGAAWGVLAVLTSSPHTDWKVVEAVEQCAREMTHVLAQPGMLSAPHEDVLLHELRVPLGAANYALEALAQRHGATLAGDDQHLLRTAQLGLMQAQSIMRLASQLQASGDELTKPDMRAISIGEALEYALVLLSAARSRVYSELAVDLPLAWGNEFWLTQALTNLLENALKYSWPRSRIQVDAQPTDRDRVLISVHSHGKKVPGGYQRIFEPYVRGARSDDLTSKGLGLCIAHHLITAMGGDIWMEGDGHHATTVMLTLPTACGNAREEVSDEVPSMWRRNTRG
jgi:signal transduction histidine kinase